MQNDSMKNQPLSRTAVHTSHKWSPPTTESRQSYFIGSILPFSRRQLNLRELRLLEFKLFSKAGFILRQHNRDCTYESFHIHHGGYNYDFPSYIAFRNWMKTLYNGTISENLLSYYILKPKWSMPDVEYSHELSRYLCNTMEFQNVHPERCSYFIDISLLKLKCSHRCIN